MFGKGIICSLKKIYIKCPSINNTTISAFSVKYKIGRNTGPIPFWIGFGKLLSNWHGFDSEFLNRIIP